MNRSRNYIFVRKMDRVSMLVIQTRYHMDIFTKPAAAIASDYVTRSRLVAARSCFTAWYTRWKIYVTFSGLIKIRLASRTKLSQRRCRFRWVVRRYIIVSWRRAEPGVSRDEHTFHHRRIRLPRVYYIYFRVIV